MGPLALLGLLGAAALAGVSAVPVEKDHVEEMVTRCIVEVLSNALSKPNAPPINPECKEILRKGGRNDKERSENKQLEVRYLKDPAETEKHQTGSVEKEQSQIEEESKMYMKGSDEEKLDHEEGKSQEEEDGHYAPMHTEEKKHYQGIRKEQEKSYLSEEDGKESKSRDEEAEHAVLNRKPHSGGTSTEELPNGNDQRPMGHWHSEEGMKSPYKRIREGEEGEAEEEKSEKYYHESKVRGFSHQQEHEESDESEEREEEKQPSKPKHYQGKLRMGDTSEEKRGRGGGEEEQHEESNIEAALLWDKRNHHQKHHEESEQQHEEKSGYQERHGSEEVEEKSHAERGTEEYRERWQQSEESSEEENKKHHHREESNEKGHEERRHRDESHEARRHHSEERTYLGDESKEELDRYLSGGSKERQHRAGGRYSLWDNEDEGAQKAYARERKGQARKHYSTEDRVEQQRYPGNSEEEEEVEKKHHSSDEMENEEENMEEGRYAEMEEYRSRLPAENKRTTASYSSFYPLLWWKSQRFEKRDSIGEQLLEGKEEGRPTLDEKSLFPEYNDYDWWEQKQILSALNHGRNEKRNFGKMNRYDMKRQYKKMDSLAQLLSYRKKSAEFPELYSSGEDMKKRHLRNDRRSLSQRPLTEEEEKELENLAAMDLELQKIAEKFNDNRRG